VVNVAEEQIHRPVPAVVSEAAARHGSALMWLCAPREAEIGAMAGKEQEEFLAAYGLRRSVSQRFVKTAFELLDRICFFTVGSDEVRAWPIPVGTRARRAARTIHSDLERGFIRAEVVAYDTFVERGSEAACRAAGLMRTEGRDYEVKDGDILDVRFHV
jgi:hypothetical protein